MKEYLFVYGSLRSSGVVPAEIAAVASRFRRLGAAQVRGRLYDFGSYCGAVLDRSGNSVVHGELVELPSDEDVLQALDRYEEIDPADVENSLFARQRTTVRLAEGSDHTAWIYVYNKPTYDASVIEGGNYQQSKTKV
ncbi:MAG TPA: gamma-glutamylcyclotransferase family protein [Pyrinomonadaceae bacterium]|nr:gamma-glutamylcyclotransferase family protein [Pyrinomonadaceae bacterium]